MFLEAKNGSTRVTWHEEDNGEVLRPLRGGLGPNRVSQLLHIRVERIGGCEKMAGTLRGTVRGRPSARPAGRRQLCEFRHAHRGGTGSETFPSLLPRIRGTMGKGPMDLQW